MATRSTDKPPPRIMIVEDEALVAEDLADTLRELGYEVAHTVPTGEEAIRAAEVTAPDLILMDIFLKGEMDGIEAAERLRSRFGLPVVYLTAYVEDDLVDRAVKTAPYGYLAKPFAYAELKSVIETALFKHRMDIRVQESEEKYRTLVETLPLGVVEVDIGGTIQFVSDSYCRMIGRTSEELVGKSMLYPVSSESERDALRTYLKSLVKNQPPPTPWLGERRTSDGKTIQVRADWNYKRNAHGDLVGFIAAVSDITDRKRAREQLWDLNRLREDLLAPGNLGEKLRRITDGIVKIFDAEFARIWLIGPGDRCDSGCFHAQVTKGPHACRNRDRCLHLAASSGRYKHIDGSIHGRIPFGSHKIGRIASGEVPKVLTNEVTQDPNIHDHDWAENLGLVSFAGYRILSGERERLGVLGLFAKHALSADEDALLQGLANTTANVILAEKAREALRDSEERFRQLAQNSLVGIFIQEYGPFSYVNNRLAELLGFRPDEMVGRHVLDFVHPDDRDLVYSRKVKRIHGRDVPTQYEFRALCKDGGFKWLEIYAARIDYQNRSVIVGNVMDITERKAAEQALAESEKRYRELFEGANVAIFVAQDHKIKLVNPRAIELIGYSEEELTSRPFTDFVHPDDLSMILDRHQRRLRGEHPPDSYSCRVFDKEGRVLWMDIKAKVIEWEGRPAILVFGYDDTERKRTEEALRESEEFNRRLVEHSPMAIIYLDAQGTIEYANPASDRVLGVPNGPESQLIGFNIFDLPLMAEQPQVLEGFQRLMQGETLSDVELSYRSPLTGGDYTLLVSAAPRLTPQGSVGGAVVMFLDITERKRLEDQLRQAQKMEAVGTLAGGVAHDFNNLLQVIMGYTDILLMSKDKQDPDHEKLTAIRQAAGHGRNLVKELLTFSRTLATSFGPIDLNQEVKRIREILYRTIPKMIEIELALAEDLNTVNADPGQVEQILLNLAINARDAMPEGGKLILETRNVHLCENYCRTHLDVEPGDYVLLTVSDTGHGMAKEVLDHIFEPFYTTKRPGDGTGLGLAMVFGMVKSYGGHINCYSEPGIGTTFKIYFPARTMGIESEAANTLDEPSTGTETVLLVDDESRIRELGKEILSSAGYRVLTASNGLEALELYRKSGPEISLVILDLIMPEMGGRECLERLLEADPNVRVLIASGFSPNGPTKEVVEVGAMDFISKPFLARELLRMVRQVLDKDSRKTIPPQ